MNTGSTAEDNVSSRIMTFRGCNSERFRIKLFTPRPGEECAITLQDIVESEVDEFEGLRLDVQHPGLRAIELPCSHVFAANALAVYWLVDVMRCPLCREGIDTCLAISNLPPCWQTVATAYVARRRQQDKVDSVMDALGADLHGATDASRLVRHHVLQLCMQITLVGEDDNQTQTLSLSFTPNPHIAGTAMVMHVSRACLRQVSHAINVSGARAVYMVVLMRNLLDVLHDTPEPSQDSIVLAESGMMILPSVFCEHDEIAEVLQSQTNRVFHEVKVEQSARARPPHGNSESDTSEVIPGSNFSIQWFKHATHATLNTVENISFTVPMQHIAQVANSNVVEQVEASTP